MELLVPAQLGGLVEQTLNGLYFGAILFMIATGLTVILGVLDVLNLAHGELYAFGAYTAVSVYGFLSGSIAPAPVDTSSALVFLLVIFAGALLSAAVLIPIGAIIESVFVRPVYGRHEVYELLLTFALLNIIIDLMKGIWGRLPTRAEGVYSGINELSTTELIGFQYPSYNMIVVVVGVVVFALLIWFFDRTKTGRIIRATAINREMATAIGVNTSRTFTIVFALGAFLAGFAGAMAIPPISTSLTMGVNPLVLSFVVIVIGGLGSIQGAFVAAMLVGVTSRLATVVYPEIELAAPFALMAIVLLIKPQGLYGTWGET
jgi:branched-chain amino acid transport system permease protein